MSESKEPPFFELAKQKWDEYDWKHIGRSTVLAAVFATAGGTLGHYGYDMEENTARLEAEFNSILMEQLGTENLPEGVLKATEIIAEQAAEKERFTQTVGAAMLGMLFPLVR